MKAVVDTNVLVSALISRRAAPWEVLSAWLDGRFELVTSDALLRELDDVIGRGKIRRRPGFSNDEAALLIIRLRARATMVEPKRSIRHIERDADDDRVLEAAIAGEADVIVSGDVHLLELGEFEGIPIMTAARFVNELATANPLAPRL